MNIRNTCNLLIFPDIGLRHLHTILLLWPFTLKITLRVYTPRVVVVFTGKQEQFPIPAAAIELVPGLACENGAKSVPFARKVTTIYLEGSD